MLLETKFKEIVDATASTITIHSGDLQELSNYYNIRFTNSLSLDTVKNILKEL